jgi:hypothetical protein
MASIMMSVPTVSVKGSKVAGASKRSVMLGAPMRAKAAVRSVARKSVAVTAKNVDPFANNPPKKVRRRSYGYNNLYAIATIGFGLPSGFSRWSRRVRLVFLENEATCACHLSKANVIDLLIGIAISILLVIQTIT